MGMHYTKAEARASVSKLTWVLYKLKIVQLNWGPVWERIILLGYEQDYGWYITFRAWNPLAWLIIFPVTIFLMMEICIGHKANYRRAPK